MRPITLNLASRPFRNNILVGALLGGIGIALVGGTAYNLYVFLSYGSSYARLQREQGEDRARIATLQQEERRLSQEIKGRNFKHAYEQGKLAGELIRKRAFSWTQLFNTLETVVPPDVVMTAIRPNITAEEIVLRIEGVAKNHGALLSFEERLLRHASFAKVFPSNEKRLNPSLPDITFLLTCDYVTPRPVEPALVAAAAVEAAPDSGRSAVKAATPPQAPAATVVGRDGQPVGPPATTVVAPGGVALAAALPARATKEKPRKSAAAAAPAAPAAAQPKPPEADQARAPATAASGSSATRPQPVRPLAGPRRYDPNVPRTMPPALQAVATRLKPQPPPAPAERLDVPLSFVSRPAAEVYQRLAEAHGVRIELDPSVDPAVPVTLDLKGRKLEDALRLIGGVLRTQMTHPADGVYRITSGEVQSPRADAPPVEENLTVEQAP